MTMTTVTGRAILSAEEVGALIIVPLGKESVAGRVSTFVPTLQSSYRLPVVTDDPNTEWVAEGEEIPVSDAQVDEVATAYKKLAGLCVVSNELVADSNPEGAEVIGAGLVRDLSVKLDIAFFGSRGVNTKRPAGLGDLTTSVIDAGASWTGLDAFNEASFGAAGYGRAVTSFVANPVDALILSNLKESSGSSKHLLQPDPTQPSRQIIGGRALETSPAVAVGTVWAIPEAVAYVVVREDAEVESDRSAFFTSDRTAIRGKLRADFLFPQPMAIQKISLTPAA